MITLRYNRSMKLYHEVHADTVGSILQNGMKRTSRGDKGSDKAIIKADQYLDARRSRQIKEAGVSRDDTLYAYYATEGNIVDITDGNSISLEQFVHDSKQKVVEIDVDPNRCYVSDLDTYDSLKSALEKGEKPDSVEALAKSYWLKLTLLSEYDGKTIRRPEIMITYDVEPMKLRLLN